MDTKADAPDVVTYLKMVSHLVGGSAPAVRDDWAYKSIDGAILAMGQPWAPAPLPAHVELGEMSECFENAFHLAVENPTEFTYVEGYASNIIPVNHAWCVDAGGRVVDPTWDDAAECQYYGVRIPYNELMGCILRTGYYGVFVNDWRCDQFILRKGVFI